MSYAYLPHTADLRVQLAAPNLPALYQTATEALREILVGSCPVAERERRSLVIDAEGEAERFFRFVRELLYLYDSEAFVPARVTVDGTLTVAGEPFDPARHTSERQLKAVTRHGFRFGRSASGYEAEMVFDI